MFRFCASPRPLQALSADLCVCDVFSTSSPGTDSDKEKEKEKDKINSLSNTSDEDTGYRGKGKSITTLFLTPINDFKSDMVVFACVCSV